MSEPEQTAADLAALETEIEELLEAVDEQLVSLHSLREQLELERQKLHQSRYRMEHAQGQSGTTYSGP